MAYYFYAFDVICYLLTLGDIVKGIIDLVPVSGLGDRSALGLKGIRCPKRILVINNKI
jgi:hypothetical protein